MSSSQILIALVGLLVASVTTIVGYLLSRSIGEMDKKIDTTAADVKLTTSAVGKMQNEMTGYSLLATYLKEEVMDLKHQNGILHSAVGAMDKLIAVQIAAGKLTKID